MPGGRKLRGLICYAAFRNRAVLLTILIVLGSCCTHPKTKEDLFWYSGGSGPFEVDTFTIDRIDQVNNRDSLVGTIDFNYRNREYRISVFNNEAHAPVDGSGLTFNLDDLGIIYSKNFTWRSYSRLRSTNNSINGLVDRALEAIILDSKEYRIVPSKHKSIHFIEPKTE